MPKWERVGAVGELDRAFLDEMDFLDMGVIPKRLKNNLEKSVDKKRRRGIRKENSEGT